MIVRQPFCVAVGYTHADIVSPVVTFRLVDAGTDTRLLVPLNTSAPPYFPLGVHVAPEIVPVFVFPDASPTVGPEPSSNAYAAASVAASACGPDEAETTASTSRCRAFTLKCGRWRSDESKAVPPG
jgi:hypothetical protein